MSYSIIYLPPLTGAYDWSRLKTPELYGFTAQVICNFTISNSAG